jgi:hypothetical protein
LRTRVRACECVCLYVYVWLLSCNGGHSKFECFVKLLVVRLLSPFCALLLLQGNVYCKGIVVLLGNNCSLSAPSPKCSQKVAFALASKLLEVYNNVTFIYIADLLSSKKWQFSGSVNATWCWMDGAQHTTWRIIVKNWKRNAVLLYLYLIESQCISQCCFYKERVTMIAWYRWVHDMKEEREYRH